MTRRQIRKWVRAGAMHPVALVGDRLKRHVHDHYDGMWDDLGDFPWPPTAPTLRDATAAVCQDEFRFLWISVRHHYRLVDRVWREVFGVPWERTAKGGVL